MPRRAVDTRSFTSAGEVTAVNGQSNYSFADKLPVAGVWYYRLKEVRADGSQQYSKTVVVRYHDNSPVISLRPSVTSEPWLKVFVEMPGSGQLTLQVTDVAGRTLIRQRVMAEKGDNVFKLDIASLNKGVFYVRVLNKEGFNKTIIAEKR